MVDVGYTPLICYQKNLQDQKKNRKTQQSNIKNLHHEFTWFENVPTSTGNAALHYHIDHEQFQVQYNQQLALISLGFSFQNLFQSLNSLSLLNSLFFYNYSDFSLSKTMSALHDQEYIYTLDASPRNKGYTLVSKPIQL